MSATGKIARTGGLPVEVSETCKIVIVYEDSDARGTGMKVCERLAEQLGDDIDFEFKWCSFRRLIDPEGVFRTRTMAADADIVMFCASGSELPAEISAWLESWSEFGSQNEGAIALVMTETHTMTETVQRMVTKFEKTAQKLGMDFLQLAAPVFNGTTPVAHKIETPFPPAFGSNVERSHNYHWGLND